MQLPVSFIFHNYFVLGKLGSALYIAHVTFDPFHPYNRPFTDGPMMHEETQIHSIMVL